MSLNPEKKRFSITRNESLTQLVWFIPSFEMELWLGNCLKTSNYNQLPQQLAIIIICPLCDCHQTLMILYPLGSLESKILERPHMVQRGYAARSTVPQEGDDVIL